MPLQKALPSAPRWHPPTLRLLSISPWFGFSSEHLSPPGTVAYMDVFLGLLVHQIRKGRDLVCPLLYALHPLRSRCSVNVTSPCGQMEEMLGGRGDGARPVLDPSLLPLTRASRHQEPLLCARQLRHPSLVCPTWLPSACVLSHFSRVRPVTL